MFGRLGQKLAGAVTGRAAVTTAAAVAGVGLVGGGVAMASSDNIHAPAYPWNHAGPVSAFDTGAIRRGFEVYRNVCSTCHSMDLLAYRNLVGVSHTEEQAKALALSVDVTDGPNDEGEMFTRPGKLSDHFVRPYANDEAARAANNGALPPDLTCIVKARPGGADYVFSLLTGYTEPPPGVSIREGLHYNPYFTGGALGMAKPLDDDQVEYEDGTPATVSQMAKDVTTFLAWASEPEQDERKLHGFKWCAALVLMIGLTAYHKRFRWSTIKTRKIEWTK